MSSLFVALFAFVASSFRTRTALQAEILALRHQLAVFQKNAPLRLRLERSDRLLWVLLSRWWPAIRDRLAPPSVRLVLDSQITPASGKTERGRRDSPLDSRDVPSEPVVGSTAHSRGTAQARNRPRTIDRG